MQTTFFGTAVVASVQENGALVKQTEKEKSFRGVFGLTDFCRSQATRY